MSRAIKVRAIAIDSDLHEAYKQWCSVRGLCLKTYTEEAIKRAMRVTKIPTIREKLETKPVKYPAYLAPISEARDYPPEIYNSAPFWEDKNITAWGEQRALMMLLSEVQDEIKSTSPTNARYHALAAERLALEKRLGLTPTLVPALNDPAEILQAGRCSLCGIKGPTIDDVCPTCAERCQ